MFHTLGAAQPLSPQSAGLAHIAFSRGTAELGHASFLGWGQRGNLEQSTGSRGMCRLQQDRPVVNTMNPMNL